MQNDNVTTTKTNVITNLYTKPVSLKGIVDAIKQRISKCTDEDAQRIRIMKKQIALMKAEASRRKLVAKLTKETADLEAELKKMEG